MGQAGLFSILHSVDSTNNYAMAKLHAGLANHGMAWFAEHQFAGKGQRGKTWISSKAQNVILSVVIDPAGIEAARQFEISVITALSCYQVFRKYAGADTKIKWPNDLYYRDRKAGGILIENILHGRNWKFSVIGIGININQLDFGEYANSATSLLRITGITYDPVAIAKELHVHLLDNFEKSRLIPFRELLANYNNVLYKKGELVNLKLKDRIREVLLKEVDENGRLLTQGDQHEAHEFGSVEWIIP